MTSTPFPSRPDPKDGIYLYGAREHNLKKVNVFIPRNKMTVVTGLSGSGKSSLVFDTVYAEGQRRYVESLSSYARFFINNLKKPELQSVKGLSPPVAIDQHSLNTSPRSTVGTVTEIYDYLRLLFARLGTPFCVHHQKPLQKNSVEQITKEVMKLKPGFRFFVLAPVARGQKGEFAKEWGRFLSAGFTQARINGQWMSLENPPKLHKRKDHFIDLLVDRLIVKPEFEDRLKLSLARAVEEGKGFVTIEEVSVSPESQGGRSSPKGRHYCVHGRCPVCGSGFPELEPKLFSFNNPKGACTTCQGLGWLSEGETEDRQDQDIQDEDPLLQKICPTCQGGRLNPFALSVRIKNKNIDQLSRMNIADLRVFLKGLKFADRYQTVADKILEKLNIGLQFLEKTGLSYLSLHRPIRTLSGGEAARIRLMSQLSSSLVGVLYILDEPSRGLHPKDHDLLLDVLNEIRDRGNTVLMVEHDEKTIRIADHLIDLGPGAGSQGGYIVEKGTLKEMTASPKSLTGAYLSGRKKITVPGQRYPGRGEELHLMGCKGNNLRNIQVRIPLGCLVGVSGPSGSGKSTLVMDTLYPALRQHFYPQEGFSPAPCQKIKGLQFLDKVVAVNQKPIGRTARSIPATYVGIMSVIRVLMSQLPQAKMRGYTPGHFSFNVKGGRCEHCLGTGQIKQEMLFLPSAAYTCEICQGQRYAGDILNIRYRNKNIHDILNMTIRQAARFFENHFLMRRGLKLLEEVGLGYLTLGQSSKTLSGGEAQRIKLTRELSKKNTGRTLYILDEPTTGLHFQDISHLIGVLRKLVSKGSTVVVIEHQMDVIKSCDYVIDLGPGGGLQGGRLMAQGVPEKVALSPQSPTAPYLKQALAPTPRRK